MKKLTPEERAKRAEQRAEREKQLAAELAEWKKEQAEKLAQKEKEKAAKRAAREKQEAERRAQWEKQQGENEATVRAALEEYEHFPPRKILAWGKDGLNEFIKIEGRWYWWCRGDSDFLFFRHLFFESSDFDVQVLPEPPSELAHLLPAPVEGEKEWEYRQRARIHDALPNLTIEALMPMPEDLARSWAYRPGSRCPRCDGPYYRQGKGYLQAFRSANYFITRCVHDTGRDFFEHGERVHVPRSCGYETHYKIIPGAAGAVFRERNVGRIKVNPYEQSPEEIEQRIRELREEDQKKEFAKSTWRPVWLDQYEPTHLITRPSVKIIVWKHSRKKENTCPYQQAKEQVFLDENKFRYISTVDDRCQCNRHLQIVEQNHKVALHSSDPTVCLQRAVEYCNYRDYDMREKYEHPRPTSEPVVPPPPQPEPPPLPPSKSEAPEDRVPDRVTGPSVLLPEIAEQRLSDKQRLAALKKYQKDQRDRLKKKEV